MDRNLPADTSPLVLPLALALALLLLLLLVDAVASPEDDAAATVATVGRPSVDVGRKDGSSDRNIMTRNKSCCVLILFYIRMIYSIVDCNATPASSTVVRSFAVGCVGCKGFLTFRERSMPISRAGYTSTYTYSHRCATAIDFAVQVFITLIFGV